MKWSMDTHKYISEITRKALQVMVSHGITSESGPEEIDAVERELGTCGVYRNYDGAKGRVRRALFTYFKAYGCLDYSEQLTELGRLYVENKITIQEFSFYYILNYIYDNEDIKYYPSELVLRCYYKLHEKDPNEAHLSAYDFSKIIECDSIEDINDNFINDLINARNVAPLSVNERAIGYDVWAKMFVQAGIFKRNAERNLVAEDLRLIKWILDSYEKGFETNMGSICTGILNNFPVMDVTRSEGDVQNFIDEGKALQAFLFEGIDESVIDKYIMKSEQYCFNDLKKALGLNDMHKAYFNAFTGLERLVGYCLTNNENVQIKIIGEILASIELTEEQVLDLLHKELSMDYDTLDRLTTGCNVLLYGVPGAGKSWTIEHEYCDNEEYIERLVFHPDYMYSDFVGQILPVVKADDKVRYEFTPGPFTKLLAKAYKNPDKSFYLIIEEINRGNAPAIFGEIFQLLDRKDEDEYDEDGNLLYRAGTSEYGITNANIARIVYDNEEHKVRIPSNMSILGTMNTSDQNVFTLDTAFQRRWIMRMIPNSFKNHKFADKKILDTTVSWKQFCEAINEEILRRNNITSSEDKRLGAYFVSASDLQMKSITDDMDEKQKIQVEHHNNRFAEKVLKYLWDDAFKFSHQDTFSTRQFGSLEKIIEAFMSEEKTGNERFRVFHDNLRKLILDGVSENTSNEDAANLQ